MITSNGSNFFADWSDIRFSRRRIRRFWSSCAKEPAVAGNARGVRNRCALSDVPHVRGADRGCAIGHIGNARLLVIAGWIFVAGIVLFSGSLYTLALTGVGTLGAITPIGGMLFLIGWLCLAVFALA